MRRWIFRALTVLLAWVTVQVGYVSPAIAQTGMSNISESQFQQLEDLSGKAFEAAQMGDFSTAEQYFTQMLEIYPNNPAIWSNRGIVRVSQNRLQEAIADYDRAVELAPNVTDPYLNRGAALEGLGKWEEAISDYDRALELDPKDVQAYNNRGNAKGGLGDWQGAIADYRKASELAPNFAFARANLALALYQIGETEEAMRTMRNLNRKYPQFPDMRAALTAALWEQGKSGEAESNWVAAVGLDSRYKDLEWVRNVRRWPSVMVEALEKFLKVS